MQLVISVSYPVYTTLRDRSFTSDAVFGHTTYRNEGLEMYLYNPSTNKFAMSSATAGESISITSDITKAVPYVYTTYRRTALSTTYHGLKSNDQGSSTNCIGYSNNTTCVATNLQVNNSNARLNESTSAGTRGGVSVTPYRQLENKFFTHNIITYHDRYVNFTYSGLVIDDKTSDSIYIAFLTSEDFTLLNGGNVPSNRILGAKEITPNGEYYLYCPNNGLYATGNIDGSIVKTTANSGEAALYRISNIGVNAGYYAIHTASQTSDANVASLNQSGGSSAKIGGDVIAYRLGSGSSYDNGSTMTIKFALMPGSIYLENSSGGIMISTTADKFGYDQTMTYSRTPYTVTEKTDGYHFEEDRYFVYNGGVIKVHYTYAINQATRTYNYTVSEEVTTIQVYYVQDGVRKVINDFTDYDTAYYSYLDNNQLVQAGSLDLSSFHPGRYTHNINESRTGDWTDADERAAYDQIKKLLSREAVDAGLITRAKRSGEKQITDMFKNFGFAAVNIVYRKDQRDDLEKTLDGQQNLVMPQKE